jgi:hypothetical protein
MMPMSKFRANVWRPSKGSLRVFGPSSLSQPLIIHPVYTISSCSSPDPSSSPESRRSRGYPRDMPSFRQSAARQACLNGKRIPSANPHRQKTRNVSFRLIK